MIVKKYAKIANEKRREARSLLRKRNAGQKLSPDQEKKIQNVLGLKAASPQAYKAKLKKKSEIRTKKVADIMAKLKARKDQVAAAQKKKEAERKAVAAAKKAKIDKEKKERKEQRMKDKPASSGKRRRPQPKKEGQKK